VENSGAGSTLLLLVAAALWLVYLVPLWMKRSEYYATEANAARLAQTLRLLANTSEASKEIKAELKARSIAKKEREAQRQLRIMASPTLSLAERRRRTKQIFSLTLATGIVAGVSAFLAAWPLEVIWASSTVATVSFAILGRLKCQIIPYQIFLAANDIPFCAAEDLQVFLSDAFDKLISLLDIKARSEETRSKTSVASDMLSLCNLVLLYPLQKADEQKLRYFFLSKSFSSLLLAAEGMSQCELSVKTMNSGEIADRILKFINAETVSSTIKALAEGFESLQKHYAKAEDDIWHVDPPFASLGDFASRYGDRFDDFISDLIIAKDKLAVIPSDDDDSSEKWEIWKKPVHLMTAIRAKGKEFSTVVLLDVVDGVWPSKMAKSHVKKEAERRVFYVAVTRAKERMVMFVNRLFRGKPAVASQYIEELGLEWK
jgi:superfamily I DNA/RNA helicase